MIMYRIVHKKLSYSLLFQCGIILYLFLEYKSMAIASGPAGLVLAGPVFMVILEHAHVQIMNNE